VENLANTLGYDNAFAVSSTGRSGGLAIFWNNEIKIELLPYSQYHIDAIVSPASEESWRLTCVYGEAQVRERHKTWDMLKFIKASSHLPWLCIGDFNEVLLREEHMGVNERSNTQIQAFRETVDVCQLMDLGYNGTPWTFEKKVAGGSYCRVRLDRALATASWCERYPLAALQHLTAAASDHSAILLPFEPTLEPPLQAKLFRYEAMWETHQDFKPVMDREWRLDTCTSMHGLERKLKGLSQSLSEWGHDTFGFSTRLALISCCMHAQSILLSFFQHEAYFQFSLLAIPF
jgi:hypothetical protein